MFERLRKAFFKPALPPTTSQFRGPDLAGLRIWAEKRGLRLIPGSDERSFRLAGQTGGIAWELESGKPSRDFIAGGELRGRTELGIHPDAAVLILNRPLREHLEQRAFADFTDSLRTEADAKMPEEVRWLSMYDEVSVRAAPIGFHDMYAVLAYNPLHAQEWITEELATELMRWPQPVGPTTPMTLMTLRGKLYLRLQFPMVSMDVLTHAARLYGMACERAASSLPRLTLPAN